MNYCTITDAQYKRRTEVLLRSLKAHCKPARLWVLSLDGTTISGTTTINLAYTITPKLKKAREIIDRRQFAWATKPLLLNFVISLVDSVCYVDSDGMFFSNPKSLFDSIRADIAITPHRFPPEHVHYAVNGHFNAGFMLFRRSNTTYNCLANWESAILANPDDLYAEQRHLDQWIESYGAVSINHPGVNLAPWNQAQYTYEWNGGYKVNGHSIIWYHFHEGLGTGYELNPFVKTHLYAEYERQLGG